ncbi:VPLPA-CTERM sorting domain-containing protein [Frigidibacter sp. MR17.24]|uniref:VPLPA-CTERM sorting domain-containing protein n=1 Tax=Frigidibacter sp. MR17.24 TaxID=3127345 RepID=UPI003012AE50
MPAIARLLVGASFFACLSSAAPAASITYFAAGQYDDFIAGLSSYALEDFADASYVPGLSWTTAMTGPAIPRLEFSVDTIPDSPTDTRVLSPGVLSFATPVTAFHALWDLQGPGGIGSGLSLTLGLADGSTQLIGYLPPRTSLSYIGFYSSTPFTSLIFAEGGWPGAYKERFSLDNVIFGQTLAAAPPAPPTAPVPLPAGLPLLGAGLAALAALRRRRARMH